MPVPESSYSRRYGREDSTAYSSTYSRSTSSSALGGSAGRSSYLSYTSKATSTLPPRPPAYEYRSKYADSSSIGSRFLSNSASRVGGRDYGSSNSYRTSVSPVRASASSIRRQLEATAPTIAERIKAMELGESSDQDATTTAATPSTGFSSRVSRLRSSRGESISASNAYSSSSPSYSRDRSGSREFGSSPLISSSYNYGRGGDSSNKSSTENLHRNSSRVSPSPNSGPPLSRSGSGAGMKNGLSSRLGSIEVNSENATTCGSASKGVTTVISANTTTTSTTTTPKTGSVIVDDDIDGVEKCVKDVENNDPNSIETNSSVASSSSVSATSNVQAEMNGFPTTSNKVNNDSEKDFGVPVVSKSGGDDASAAPPKKSTGAKSSINPPRVVASSSQAEKVLSNGSSSNNISGVSLMDGHSSDGCDSNGNPISIVTACAPSTKMEDTSLLVKGSGLGGSRKGSSSSPLGPTTTGTKAPSRFLKKCESDNNANNLQESCNGEPSASHKKEKSSYDAVLNYSPKSASLAARKPTINKSSSPPKVIYHTIQVEEEPRNSVSPEPVYTLTARPSLDGTGPKIEIKNVTKTKKTSSPSPSSNETVSADFKVTLPKLKSSAISSTSFENGHNNASSAGDEDSEDNYSQNNKLITVVDVDSMNATRKSEPKETSPAFSTSKKEASPFIVDKTKASPSTTPDKQVTKTKSALATRRSLSKSRESTPTSSTANKLSNGVSLKEKSATPPPPPTINDNSSETKTTNGEVHVESHNINNSDAHMGPHSSKYNAYTNGSQRDSPNRNERYGRSSHVTSAATNNTDSSDNESDALTSSPRSSGRFRSKDGFEKAGLTGLRNIGNTCFMNTVLQCLSNTRPLLEYVMGHYDSDINRSTSGMKGALMRAFGELIHELWRDQRVVDTSAFKDSIQRFAPRFMGYSQQDAQEFLRYLLEGLHEDVNRVTAKPTPITTDIDESLSDGEKATESWRRYMRYESSRIVDMFVGQFKSTLKCTVCGHCSVTFDPFWDLSLPIPSRSSTVRLSQCFELLTKEEVLDGEEKPTCAKCQCRRKCTKSLAIQKFPKILVVHLKRFSLAERYRGKLSTLVDYPLNGLDLTPFSSTRGNVGAYNLYGVANHSGSTYSGHYIAYCKHPYSNEWHCYNDSRVSPISSHSVVSPEGYVLFYEQVGQSSLL